jgi:DNA-binding LytR/AlgR family response regulator
VSNEVWLRHIYFDSYHVISNPAGLTSSAVLDDFLITAENGRPRRHDSVNQALKTYSTFVPTTVTMNLISPVLASQRTKPIRATLRVYFPKQGQQQLAVSELVYLQSEENYTWLFWADGQRTLLPRTLKYIEAKLPPNAFVRLHRHHTVNSSHVVGVCQTAGGLAIKLSNGQSLEVARRRMSQIRKQFQSLLERLDSRP